MRRTAALIVGGGPAGSAAAIMLARGGAAPHLVERTTQPHDTVCGGFLGRDALASLARLGIDVGVLGARPIGRVRIVAGTRSVAAALPFAAAGLSRRTLDEALLAAAIVAGARVDRGRTARAAEGDTVRFADGAALSADALLLATGKHDLRGLPRPRIAAPSLGFRVALEPDAALERALAGTVELHLFDGGYAGLLLQEDGRANLCLSIDARIAAGRDGPALAATLAAQSPILAERAARAGTEGWSAIAQVPYGWRARSGTAGLYRLGDQAAVIASLVGDGVAIALASGIAAGDAIVRGGAAAARFQPRFAAQARRPLGVAGTIRALAESPLSRPGALAMLGHAPWLVRALARLTRIDPLLQDVPDAGPARLVASADRA